MFDISVLNGLTYDTDHIAVVPAVNTLGGGAYSIDAGQFSGSISDVFGPDPSANLASASLTTFNAAQNVIQYAFVYQDGTPVPAFAGLVLGYNENQFLVQQYSVFVDLGGGNFLGVLDPAHYDVFSTTNLSQFNNPTPGFPAFPQEFGQTGPGPLLPGAVPEPSSVLMIGVAVMAMVAIRFFRRGGSIGQAA